MTILFEEDFEIKHPQAIVDYDTRNREFVRLAALYTKMGVPHAGKMILALHDRGLKGIDPFNPPSPEYATRVAIECKDNFWYFIREIARDPAGSEEQPIYFVPNRGVIAAYWLYFNHIVFFLIMIRQTGKSFGIDWLYIWLLNIGTTKYEIAQLTKDEKLRSRELERLKAMELTLPKYLKMRQDRDPGNTETMRISRHENYFKSYLPNKSPKIADMVGRGMTASTAGVDELAYIFNNHITVPVMLSATLAAREVSRKKGEPYGTIFTTTSGKRDTPEGRYAYRLVHEGAVWSEQFMKVKNLEELEKVILNACPGDAKGEKRLHVNCTFNHRQLGKTDKWLADRLKESIQEDPVQMQADYFNMWPSGTTSSPFSREVAEMIRQGIVDDYYTQIDGNDMYALRWYYSEDAILSKMLNAHHILCIDSSDAIGRDALGVNLINVMTGEEAMAATVPKTNLITFAKWVADFLEVNLNVTLIVERRGSGQTIIDYLLLYLPARGINPFTRIYNTIVQEAESFPDRYEEIKNPYAAGEDIYTKYKKAFGWATSGTGSTSRSDLYSKTLSIATRMGGKVIRDKILIHQLLGLVIKNGRVDHQDGEHDDMVVSWLLGWWLMTNGKNLSHYGINPRDILCVNEAVVQAQRSQSTLERYQHEMAKASIERIKSLIEGETDPYIIRRYEADLLRALEMISSEDREVIAADDLLQQLRDKRENAYRPGMGTETRNYLESAIQSYPSFGGMQSYNNYANGPYSVGTFSSDRFI